jgi:hypothetical protein
MRSFALPALCEMDQVSGGTPRMAEATGRPKKIKEECAILNSISGAGVQ